MKITATIISFFILTIAWSQELDASFGTNGKVITPFVWPTSAEIQDILLQPDEKILVAGSFVARYNPDGSLDAGFGTSGIISIGTGNDFFSAVKLMLLADGKILAAGRSFNGDQNNDFTIYRLNPDGSVDPGFGNNGKAFLANSNFATFSEDMVLQTDGKIIIGGGMLQGLAQPDVALARFNADGSVDASYGTNGLVAINFGETVMGGGHLSSEMVYGLEILPDNKVLAGGSTNVGNHNELDDFFVMRLDSNGTLDSTFGAQGKSIVNVSGIGNDFESIDSARALTLDNNGKILLGGQTTGTGGLHFAMMRLEANGSLDASFGSGGKVTTEVSVGAYSTNWITSLLVDVGGKIYAGGGTRGSAQLRDFAALRYNPDGTPDTAFGENGLILTDFNGNADGAQAIALQPDGKLILGGAAETDTDIYDYDFALVRYTLESLQSASFPVSKFSAYPNPFEQVIHLDFNLLENQVLTVNLVDISGKTINLVSNRDFSMGSHSVSFELPASIGKGVYFLNIADNQNTTSIKVIK